MSQESLPKKQGEHAEADHAQGPAVGPAQNTEVITKLLPQWIGFLGKIWAGNHRFSHEMID